jgi:beta-phosphoglucomutase-like phosphatase (HAD superfamily)
MRALVFDFDGLIVDSETPEYLCWKQVFEDHGQSLPVEDWVHVVGGAVIVDMRLELERRLGRQVDWAPVNERRIAHYSSIFDQQSLLPGVQELCAIDKEGRVSAAREDAMRLLGGSVPPIDGTKRVEVFSCGEVVHVDLLLQLGRV